MVVKELELPTEAEHAREAGLTYVSDAEPGILRRKAGTGFSYRGPDGRVVKDKAVLARIRHLAVPPAYVDVWICARDNGHIQATGRDARGRKQYRYHAAWREIRDTNKYGHLLEFARLLPKIRARINSDMARRGMGREKVLATVVSLLDKTLIRIGNSIYSKTNGSYGLTTLKTKHVDLDGNELRFEFKGKSGKTWKLSVRDRRIARVVRSIEELPGQHLFQYLTDEQEVRQVSSTDVNSYLRDIAGSEVSAKDFRTWAGTVLALWAFDAVGPHTSQTDAKRKIKSVIEAVALKLGNTPTICRKCYVHPDVVTSYLEGTLTPGQLKTVAESAGDDAGLLAHEERALVKFLTRRLTPSTAA
jgi:DNA topoisomerase I